MALVSTLHSEGKFSFAVFFPKKPKFFTSPKALFKLFGAFLASSTGAVGGLQSGRGYTEPSGSYMEILLMEQILH